MQAVNAQAKGLTNVLQEMYPLERGRIQCDPPKEQTCIARRISQVKRTAGVTHGYWPWNLLDPSPLSESADGQHARQPSQNTA